MLTQHAHLTETPLNTTLLYIGETGVYRGSFNHIFSVFFVSFRFVSFLLNNFSVMSGRNHRFPGYYQYFWEVNVSCSRTQHGDLSDDRIPDLSPRSPTLYN